MPVRVHVSQGTAALKQARRGQNPAFRSGDGLNRYKAGEWGAWGVWGVWVVCYIADSRQIKVRPCGANSPLSFGNERVPAVVNSTEIRLAHGIGDRVHADGVVPGKRRLPDNVRSFVFWGRPSISFKSDHNRVWVAFHSNEPCLTIVPADQHGWNTRERGKSS
eukprot:911047-Rhodomonas_salina.2